jgi:hypothetical protein
MVQPNPQIVLQRIRYLLTDPIDMKNPKVAADDSMYCDRVANAPRGPGPPLELEGMLF